MLNDPGDAKDADGLSNPESEPPEVAELREEIDEVERDAARRIEPGTRGFFIAVLVFLLIVTQLLPWVDGSPGWRVLLYGEDGALPRLFAATSAGFGIVGSALTLITRRWWLSWVCAVGTCIAAVDGLLAIWSQQSSGASGEPGAGPGIGMVLALIVVILLAAGWLRTAWSRMD